MKNLFNKNQKRIKNPKGNYILKDSIKAINKHFSDLSISIAGEFTNQNSILIKRQYFKSDFEMF